MRPLVLVHPGDYEVAIGYPLAPFEPVLVLAPTPANEWLGQSPLMVTHPDCIPLCRTLLDALPSMEIVDPSRFQGAATFADVLQEIGTERVLRVLAPVLSYVGPGERVPPSVIAQRARRLLPTQLRGLLDTALVEGNLYRWMVDRRALYSREPQSFTKRDTKAVEILRLIAANPELPNQEIARRLGCDPTWPAKVRKSLSGNLSPA